METLREIVLQEMNEERFNRKHIDVKIRKAIQDNPITLAKLKHGEELVKEWMAAKHYKSKTQRIEQLRNMDVMALVTEIFVGIAYVQVPSLFVSVSAQMASRLKFSDKTGAITTVAELLGLLCQTDAFDIEKPSKMGSLMLVSYIELPESLVEFIENSEYLPPMVCTPLELKHNFSSGYLTHNDSLILGSGNHHDGDLCLDVLNIMNAVPLKLDLQFLSTVEEEPNTPITPENVKAAALKEGKTMFAPELKEAVRIQLEQWKSFKQQSYVMYNLMAQQGNRFYLTHKVDKRGRIYSQGYHITTMGASFKKAMIEFANEELVEGVPNA